MHALPLALLVGLVAVPVLAAETAGPVRIEYSAPEGCPSREDFLSRVKARGGDPAAPSRAGSVIVASIRSDSAGFRGSVLLRNGGSSSNEREVSSWSCDEVADGLAVVSAITLRSAEGEPEPKPANSVENVPSAPVAPPHAAPRPEATPETKPEPRRLRTLGQFRDASVRVEAGELGVNHDFAPTLSAGAAFGPFPSKLVPRFDLEFARTNFVTTPEGNGYIVGGILKGRWTLLGPVSYERSGHAVDMLAFKAGISGCSELAYDREGLVLLACGEIAAGVMTLNTRAQNERAPREETRGIGTAGFELDARYNLSRHFHIQLALGGELWLAEVPAERADGSEILRTGFVSGYGSFGIGFHF